MAVVGLLAVGVGDPEVDVGVVGIPGERDAQVERQVAQQALVVGLGAQRWAAACGAIDHHVELGERGHVDVGEAAVPGARHHLPQLVGTVLPLAGVVVREAEVAVRLRLVRAQALHGAQHGDRKRRLFRLQQAVAEHTQDVAVLQLHLGQVRQHPQRQLGPALGEEHVGRVEEEGGAVGEVGALVEVTLVHGLGRCGTQAACIGRIGCPGGEVDGGLRGAVVVAACALGLALRRVARFTRALGPHGRGCSAG